MHLVMFDIDGTLVDSNALDGELYCRAVKDVLGVEVDRTWSSYSEITDSGVLEEVLHAMPDPPVADAAACVERAFVEYVRAHLAREGASVREVPGARRLVLELLARDSCCVAIATGGWRETAILKLRHVGIDPSTVAIATASDARERTRIMQIAEQRARTPVPYARRTYFGDGAWDRHASERLGYGFVAVGGHVEHDVRYGDLSDTAAILEHLGV